MVADVLPPTDSDHQARTVEVAQQTLAELLARMKIQAEITAHWGDPAADEEADALLLEVTGEDLGLLIGPRGETVAALQTITRLIVSKELNAGVNLVVDVEGHRRRREEQLRRMARKLAEQAVQRQRTLTLEPMPASERRLIHLELRDHPEVRTESVGEGDRRKVTIIPKKPGE